MKDSDEESEANDSEPEMFDNVLEKSSNPQLIDQSDLTQSDDEEIEEKEETPIKPPPKKKLGPKPAATSKRKIETSDSESSPIKKKVKNCNNY